MAKDTGGPAFPANHFDLADNEHGMTLRDWFAGMALQGLLAKHGIAESAWETIAPDENASLAYILADAMIKERAEND